MAEGNQVSAGNLDQFVDDAMDRLRGFRQAVDEATSEAFDGKPVACSSSQGGRGLVQRVRTVLSGPSRPQTLAALAALISSNRRTHENAPRSAQVRQGHGCSGRASCGVTRSLRQSQPKSVSVNAAASGRMRACAAHAHSAFNLLVGIWSCCRKQPCLLHPHRSSCTAAPHRPTAQQAQAPFTSRSQRQQLPNGHLLMA